MNRLTRSLFVLLVLGRALAASVRGAVAREPLLSIAEPSDDAVYLIPEDHMVMPVIALVYATANEDQLRNLPPQRDRDDEEAALKVLRIEACFELAAASAVDQATQHECVAVKEAEEGDADLNAYNVAAGDYSLKMWLQQVVQSPPEADINTGHRSKRTVRISGSEVTRSVRIVTYAAAYPQLSSATSQKMLVADASKNTVDASIEFIVSAGSLISKDEVQVCVSVSDRMQSAAAPLVQSCLPSDRTDLYLYHLGLGQYLVTFHLKDLFRGKRTSAPLLPVADAARSDPSPPLEHEKLLLFTAVTVQLDVVPLEKALPRIQFDNEILEFAAKEPKYEEGDVVIAYALEGHPGAVEQVQVCITIHTSSAADQDNVDLRKSMFDKLVLRYQCIPRADTMLTLSRTPVGSYRATMVLQLAAATKDAVRFTQSQQDLYFEVHAPIEFKPSYEWQLLHAWHTIPMGIETRLPLSSFGPHARKEARIPQPWQLQLQMPSPCRYFLRMDVHRTTTIRDIRREAGKQCKRDEVCFEVYADGKLLTDDEEMLNSSVEHIDLFSKHKILRYAAECVWE